MDISNNDGIEICSSLKKVKTSDNNKDFISDLPDEILVHILSFLPIKDAINTVLLQRFGDLWRKIQVFDFDSCLYHDCDDPEGCSDYKNEYFVNVIRHVSNLHDSSMLDKLSLKFGFSTAFSKERLLPDGYDDELEWEKGTADQIEKLIRYAISRKVKVLDLNVRDVLVIPEECYDLPDVLSSNYLTYLKLAAFDITSCTKIDLKSLKVLLLDEVILNDDIMEKILVGCPFLEDLSLIDCYGLRILDCENPNLKKLMLTLDFEEDRLVIISCPYVLSLEIYGWIECAFLLKVSPVADASIFFSHRFRCEHKRYDNIRWLLRMARKCKTFSPCTWTILVLTIWNFMNVRCPSFEWKNLILKLSLTKWHHPGLSLLLRNCQSLETLTMYIYPGFADMFKQPDAQWIQAYEFDGENFWDSREATFPYLETIMVCGYVNEPYVIEMVKFLLKSATRLQKLVVSTKRSFKPTCHSWLFCGPMERLKFTPEQLQELSQKFKSLPRASPEATIYFS